MNKYSTTSPETTAPGQVCHQRQTDAAAQSDPKALLAFLKTVTRTLNAGTERDETLRTAIKEIATFVGWPIGHVYLVDEAEQILKPTNIWHLEEPEKCKPFQDLTAQTMLKRGVGMPGLVWDTAHPQWMAGVTPGPEYPRAQLAYDMGIISGFGFPLTSGETVVGVAEFLSANDRAPEAEFLECLDVIGSRLGRMITMYQSQGLIARHAKVMDHVEEIIAVTDSSGVIIDCNTSFERTFGLPKADIVGMRTGDFSAPGHDIAPTRTLAFAELDKSGVWHGELTFQIADKSARVFDVNTVKYADPVTKAAGLILSGRDITARKAAEDALRKNENRLAHAIETHDAGVFDRDYAADTTYMSDSMKALTGFGNTLTGDRQGWMDLVLDEDKYISKNAFGVLRRGDQDRFDIEYRIRTATGAVRWIRSRGMAVKNESGETVRAVGMLQDITESKDAMDALRLSNAAMEATDNAILIMDSTAPGTPIVFSNPASERMMGYTHAEVVGKNPGNVFKGGYETEEVQKLLKVEQDGGSAEVVVDALRKDGTTFLREVTVSPIVDASGIETHRISTSKDVTIEKRRERLLKRQAAVMQTMADAVIATEKDGVIIDCNPASAAMTGCERSELIGMNSRDFNVDSESGRSVADEIHDTLLAKGVWQGETGIRRMNGDIIVVESRVTAIKDEKHGLMSVVAVCRDVTERKALEQRLRLSDAILEATEVSVVLSDALAEGSPVIYVNPAFETMTGYTKEEVLGHSAREFLRLSDDHAAQPGWQHLRHAMEQEITADAILPTKRKDGTEFIRHASISPIHNASGEVTHWLSISGDVTKQKKTEDLLRRQAIIMEQMHDAVLMTDMNGIIFNCNAGYAKLSGYDRKDLIGKNSRDILPDLEDDPKILEDMIATVTAGKTWFGENRLRRRAGTVIIVESSVTPIMPDSGEVTSTVVVCRDITERKQAQQELEISRQRIEAVIEASRAGIWEMDIVKGRTFIGPVLKELSGYGDPFADDIKEWRNLVDPEDLHIYDSRYENWGGKRKMVDAEYRIKTKSGETRWVRSRGEMFGNKNGEMVRGIGLGWDVTEEKNRELRQEELEERLIQAQKMETLGTLTGGIAHDFNNILTPILGYAHLARSDNKDNEQLQAYLDRIIGGADRARELIRRILTFSRQIEPARSNVNIQAIISEVFSLITSSAPPQVDIQLTTDDSKTMALADAVQIHQALMNLCTNGLQAIGENSGTLSVTVNTPALTKEDCESKKLAIEPGRYIGISVQDSGGGIDPAIAERIFEPFFTTRAIDKGTGLGLSVVHGIIEAHQGTIFLDTGAGRGARFQIYLPASDGQAHEPAGMQ